MSAEEAFLAVAVGISLIAMLALALIRRRAARAVASDASDLRWRDDELSGPTMTISQITQEYERRRAIVDKWTARVEERIAQLEGRKYEQLDVENLLAIASDEEKRNLAAIVGLKDVEAPDRLCLAIRSAGSHSVAAAYRELRGREPGATYEVVASDVARKLGCRNLAKTASIADVERAAIEVAYAKLLEHAAPAERTALVSSVVKDQDSSVTGLATAAGALTVAHLSGFGLFTAASSSVAALTGALGVTLPFAAYTGLSTVLATVTGPIGWAALAGWAVHKFGAANYRITIPAVLAVSAIRARLMAERDIELSSLRREQKGDLATAVLRLNGLHDFLVSVGRYDSADLIPIARIPL